jgi:hypothetical protein
MESTPQRRASDGAARRFALLSENEIEFLISMLDGDNDPPQDSQRIFGELLDEMEWRKRHMREQFTYGVCLDSVMPDPDNDEFCEPAAAVARAQALRSEHRGLTVAIHVWPL